MKAIQPKNSPVKYHGQLQFGKSEFKTNFPVFSNNLEINIELFKQFIENNLPDVQITNSIEHLISQYYEQKIQHSDQIIKIIEDLTLFIIVYKNFPQNIKGSDIVEIIEQTLATIQTNIITNIEHKDIRRSLAEIAEKLHNKIPEEFNATNLSVKRDLKKLFQGSDLSKDIGNRGLNLDYIQNNPSTQSNVIEQAITVIIHKDFEINSPKKKLSDIDYVNQIKSCDLVQLLAENKSTLNLTSIERIKLKEFCNDLQESAKLANQDSANMEAFSGLVKGNERLIEAVLSKSHLNYFIGIEQNSDIYSCSVLSTLMKAIQLNEKAIYVTRNQTQGLVTLNMLSSRFSISRLNRTAFLNTIQGYGIIVNLDENSYVVGITFPKHILDSFRGSSSKAEVMIPDEAIKGLEVFFALYKTFGSNITTTSIDRLKPISEVINIYEERFIHNSYNIYNVASLLGCELSYHPFKNITTINDSNYHEYMLLYNTDLTNATTQLHYAKFDSIHNSNGEGEILIDGYKRVHDIKSKYTLISIKKNNT